MPIRQLDQGIDLARAFAGALDEPFTPVQRVLAYDFFRLVRRHQLGAGGTRRLAVQVRTADGLPLPGEPTVSVRPRGAGLHSKPWTASGVKAGQTASTAGFAITADPDAIAGEREVMVTVTAGDSRAERSLRVIVRPPPSRVATSP